MKILKALGFVCVLLTATVITVMSLFWIIWAWVMLRVVFAIGFTLVLVWGTYGWWNFARWIYKRVTEK